MITEFDEYMVHQNSDPIQQPGTSDRNFYGRYWNNGFDKDGNWLFEIAFATYPNRHVMDGHFSVSIGGMQYAFHTSRRAPNDRSETTIGPMRLEVIQPLRSIRFVIEPNDTGIELDVTFTASSLATQEPRNVMSEGTRCIMDTTRFTQFGSWKGFFVAGGQRVEFDECYGIRDRSWGVRPIGEPEAGAPGLLNKEPGVYWIWSPNFFDGFSTQFHSFEDFDGNPTQLEAVYTPLYDNPADIPREEDPGLFKFAKANHLVKWRSGTRYPESVSFDLETKEGENYHIDLEPMFRLHMLGLGYQHTEWGHAFWKGEQAHAAEEWDLEKVDPQAYQFIHVHHVCKAHLDGPNGKQTGIGTLENIVFGRHERSGLKGILDGAP